MLLIPSLKKKTRSCPIVRVSDPEELYLPLDAYRGVMTPLVRAGERVKKYQLLAESTGIFSTKLHAPVSGKIVGVSSLNGRDFLRLANDFENHAEDPSPVDPRGLTPEAFAGLLLDRGIVGSGGARLPTQLKYQGEARIQTIIFNGAECEPYLSADYALMESDAESLLKAAGVVGSILGSVRLVFAIERQNRKLAPILREAARKIDLAIEVKILPDSYPQGGELQLIKSVTGLELKKGSLPASHGILVNNIGTLHAIHRAIFEGVPYTERVITISGEKSGSVGNFMVKIGTPVGHLLQQTGSQWIPGEQLVILGGAMMGAAIESPLTPVHKGAGGLLVLARKKSREFNCIQCGVCVDVCPQRLMPLEFARSHVSGAVRNLQEYHLADCIECGACAYACPSDVPLMESIFAGKRALHNLPPGKA